MIYTWILVVLFHGEAQFPANDKDFWYESEAECESVKFLMDEMVWKKDGEPLEFVCRPRALEA